MSIGIVQNGQYVKCAEKNPDVTTPQYYYLRNATRRLTLEETFSGADGSNVLTFTYNLYNSRSVISLKHNGFTPAISTENYYYVDDIDYDGTTVTVTLYFYFVNGSVSACSTYDIEILEYGMFSG